MKNIELKTFDDIGEYIDKKFPEKSDEVYEDVIKKWNEFGKKYASKKGVYFKSHSTNIFEHNGKIVTETKEHILEGESPLKIYRQAFADIVKYVQELK